ncbi:Ceramidase [Cognatiyoonia koreensis]|uniref:Ceramidase n=1 Tax=Cognatiyoonia koreensis TaxID=364200 RepID=A0A1I0QD47_9RHOB|nr:ceramidase domain-containing protein [Cognatiyoonia koreensis]SEW24907.1 Ceramidase [Cognatiyoonia koreensis]
MDWLQQIDGYCERTDFAYWSEPLNAVTNLAFILAALFMWRRTEGVTGGRVLCVILFAIGIGSFLFHTEATVWAALADTAPIGLYILTYLFLVNRDVMGWPAWAAAFGTLAFLPYAAVVVPALNQIPFVRISNFYWTVPILLFLYAYVLRNRRPQVSRGFVTGGVVLCVSITARSLDEILCDTLPLGTHFIWHCLNGLMLGYMIHVYTRHVLAGRTQQG